VGNLKFDPRGGCVRCIEKLDVSPVSSSVSVVVSSLVLGLLTPFRFLLLPATLFFAVSDSAVVTVGFAPEVEEVSEGDGVGPPVFCCDDRSEMAGETEGPCGGGYASNSEGEDEDVALFASSDRVELKNGNCCE